MSNKLEKIKYLHFEKNMSVIDISKELSISRQCVYKYLKKLKEYKEEINNRKEDIKSKENKILDMFYNEHKKIKDIAEIQNVSMAEITRIIKKDERYQIEKNNRKKLIIAEINITKKINTF